jgi:DNA-directed RNA polymerase subunit alpha
MPRLMFQRPRRIEWEELTPRFGRMIAEPFEKGYALTVGHSLRRVLLSVLPGAAVVWAKLDGANGDRLAGVQEDVTTILMNLKKVVVRLTDDRATTVRIDVKGPRAVTAADFVAAGVQVVDAEVPVATLDAGGRLNLEVGLRVGRGYVSADRHPERAPSGAVPLDAAFSPIRRVSYTVEMSRLGKITDYEKLVVEVATDGTITPDQALVRASALLRDHFDLFTPAGAEEDDDDPFIQPAEPPVDATRPS